MLRRLAILAIALIGTTSLVQADPVPVHKHKHKKTAAKSDAKPDAAKPDQANDDLPDGPADVPRWMGKTVDKILTGDGPLDGDAAKP